MITLRRYLAVFTAISVLALPLAVAAGDPISINFGVDEPNFPGTSLAPTDLAGVIPLANWNSIPGAATSAAAGTTLALGRDGVGADSAPTPVRVSKQTGSRRCARGRADSRLRKSRDGDGSSSCRGRKTRNRGDEPSPPLFLNQPGARGDKATMELTQSFP